MSATTCTVFRFESESFAGSLKVERSTPGLILDTLPHFIESAIVMWAEESRAEDETCLAPASPPAAGAEAPEEAGLTSPGGSTAVPQMLSSSMSQFRRSGRIAAPRIERAADLGRRSSRFMNGETVKPSNPSETSSTLPVAVLWALLKPGDAARTPGQASLHNRRNTLMTAVSAGNPWEPGMPVDETIFEGFESLEECYAYFEGAGLLPSQVADHRVHMMKRVSATSSA
jgi:hypothetical protein